MASYFQDRFFFFFFLFFKEKRDGTRDLKEKQQRESGRT